MTPRDVAEQGVAIAIALLVWLVGRRYPWIAMVALGVTVLFAVTMWNRSRLLAGMLVLTVGLLVGAHWAAPRWPHAPTVVAYVCLAGFLVVCFLLR
jgi:hypothetical protein